MAATKQETRSRTRGPVAVERVAKIALSWPGVVTSAAFLFACGAGQYEVVQEDSDHLDDGRGWMQFLSQTYQEPESGIFIVDGDVPMTNIKKLREFYEQNVQSGQLIIHRNGSVDAKWNDRDKVALTYCVSTRFADRYDTVVRAMNEASSAWEAAGNVDFIHHPQEDANCTASNGNVMFDVRPVRRFGLYLARAFFPGEERKKRNILIDGSAFDPSDAADLVGILRHELGHTLGFRHEHTRPEAGKCFENDDWRALTSYDPGSVMHYPQCNGTGDWSLTLTDLDRQGVASVYGLAAVAGSRPPPPPPSGGEAPSVQTYTETGSIKPSKWKHLMTVAVQPKTTLTVTMTGSGDPDLYVRFGAQPTKSEWDCRPYGESAEESCALTVPPGVETARVSVRGHEAGTFKVVYEWTPPPWE